MQLCKHCKYNQINIQIQIHKHSKYNQINTQIQPYKYTGTANKINQNIQILLGYSICFHMVYFVHGNIPQVSVYT